MDSLCSLCTYFNSERREEQGSKENRSGEETSGECFHRMPSYVCMCENYHSHSLTPRVCVPLGLLLGSVCCGVSHIFTVTTAKISAYKVKGKLNASRHSLSPHLWIQAKPRPRRRQISNTPKHHRLLWGSSLTEVDWQKMKKCAEVWWFHISDCFRKPWMLWPTRLFLVPTSKASICDVMEVC